MSCLTFTIVNSPYGWYVKGHDLLGPFYSREAAISLAEGMSAALRLHGEACDVVIAPEERSFRPHPRLRPADAAG